MARREGADDVLGNRALDRFDVCVIGSGAGGGAAAHVLTAAGQDRAGPRGGAEPVPRARRARRRCRRRCTRTTSSSTRSGNFITPFPELEPRTFRADASATARIHPDVNVLPKCVGGAWSHADMKTPRFTGVDFEMVTAMRRAKDRASRRLEVPGLLRRRRERQLRRLAVPLRRPRAVLRRGRAADRRRRATTRIPFAPPRSAPYPMPAHEDMYLAHILRDGARRTTFLGGPLFPHKYPGGDRVALLSTTTIPRCGGRRATSAGRAAASAARTTPRARRAVTTLRRALLTGRCQLRFNCHVDRAAQRRRARDRASSTSTATGAGRRAVADAYVLAASAIESARLCLLSPDARRRRARQLERAGRAEPHVPLPDAT